MDIPLAIRVFQAKTKFTAMDCAKAMGFGGVAYFDRIKSGKVRPCLRHLEGLAKAGKMKLSELIEMGEK